jgi:quercetin dioxygenase-like cupin family protein
MKVFRWSAVTAGALCSFLALMTWARETASDNHPKDRARVVLAQALPKLNGTSLKATLVEVHYGPGEASSPHTHPCAVIGYVAEGALRTQVKGEPEMIYRAGESFYEAPNGVHLVSANASSTEPTKLLAFLICDHETPLSIDVPAPKQGGSQ